MTGYSVMNEMIFISVRRCCTARSKSLTSLCRLQSHPAQYVVLPLSSVGGRRLTHVRGRV